MTDELTPEGRIAWLRIQGIASCTNCAYLYLQDLGYSNYTVEETAVHCALRRNSQLPAHQPWDWNQDPQDDNWPATRNQACERHLETKIHVHLDVDGDVAINDYANDLPSDVLDAIRDH